MLLILFFIFSVFHQDEVIAYWYLLLSGEVELYIPAVCFIIF